MTIFCDPWLSLVIHDYYQWSMTIISDTWWQSAIHDYHQWSMIIISDPWLSLVIHNDNWLMHRFHSYSCVHAATVSWTTVHWVSTAGTSMSMCDQRPKRSSNDCIPLRLEGRSGSTEGMMRNLLAMCWKVMMMTIIYRLSLSISVKIGFVVSYTRLT